MNRLHGLHRLAMLSAFMALFTLSLGGCAHNLQRSYVEAMEDTRMAVEADVQAGLYKPDARSDKTLKAWKDANEDAFMALIAQEQVEGF
ncbi:hypothetical protein LCGC14_1452550 [marine sediment metagenome]|uniref:Uncharacterized protein n=1 Tax=marine sediment metagenome TaxID=412755 RepID=A0A0F9LY48_9ZZZZ